MLGIRCVISLYLSTGKGRLRDGRAKSITLPRWLLWENKLRLQKKPILVISATNYIIGER